ncbi:MAG: phage minor capsid protein [Oscillospiraceae bacterium]
MDLTALDALNLAAPLSDTYSAVEQRLLVAIARQLSLNDDHSLNEVSKWQIKRLSNLGMLRNDAAKIIAAGTKGVPADFADTVQQAIESTLAEDGLTDMWKNEGFSESAKQSVKHYRAQARDVYNQVNTVMKYKAESSFVSAVNAVADKWTQEMRRQQAEIADKQGFLDILNSNTADVVNGSAARTRAVRTTIHEMAQKGIPAFVDRAGREWSPEAYVNMDIRATVKNTALEAQFSVMDSLGQDVFEVSSHPGSRPKCRPWQGKLISRSGKTTEITDINGRKHEVIPLSRTSFGEPDGLFGINCGHRPRGVSDGLFRKSEVAYDDEEDKELYNKVCHQRELERQVRKSKTEAAMLDAAGDTEGARAARQRLTEQNKQLRAYCEENGLKFRSDRIRTYGSVKPLEHHYLKGDYSIAFNKISGTKEITESLAKEFSDQHDKAAKLFGLDKLDKMKAVEVAPYRNDGIFGHYTPNSGVVTVYGAGGKDGKAFLAKTAKDMKKKGAWSTDSPLHAYRHELGHAIQDQLSENDTGYAVKLKKIMELRQSILDDLTKLPESDIIKQKASLLSVYGIDEIDEIDEFISEGIAEYLNGKPRQTAKKIVDILLGRS